MSKEYKTEDGYEMIPLEENKLSQALASLSGWEKVSDEWIAREYKFDNYLDGIDFAKQIGEYAEKRQHHPSIAMGYKKVTFSISSWRAKGITELDSEMVKHSDDTYEKRISVDINHV